MFLRVCSCSLGPVRVPLPAWTSLVLCCVLSAAQCSVITLVATEKWLGKQAGGIGGIKREVSIPLPSFSPNIARSISNI